MSLNLPFFSDDIARIIDSIEAVATELCDDPQVRHGFMVACKATRLAFNVSEDRADTTGLVIPIEHAAVRDVTLGSSHNRASKPASRLHGES